MIASFDVNSGGLPRYLFKQSQVIEMGGCDIK
jgi:hypothetical protein